MRDQCECRYVRHKDRRGDARRLVDFTTTARAFDGRRERRYSRGRRTTD